MILKHGDIFLTRSGSRLGKLIRFFTRRIGESRTRVNHVGLIVTEGSVERAIVVEALQTVKKHSFLDKYLNSGNDVAIYRPLNIKDEDRWLICGYALGYVNKKYGYAKLVTHFLDWTLQGAYVFRRLTNSDKYPICSWLVARCYAKVGKSFGVAPGAASPDDIWDFVTRNPDKYEEIRPLVPLAA